MPRPEILLALLLVCLNGGPSASAADGNRLVYLDESDPYYVGLDFPKLSTPQWIGEDGVEAAVVLAIDDMRDPAGYEAFIRPILDRLKAIDGRAPLSVMTCEVKPEHPRLRHWLEEGVSLEVHTLSHPCPLLRRGDLEAARKDVDGGIDLLARVERNRPVAFRMPCCDSRNTVSPRFFAEIFNRSRPGRPFLTIDSSVFQLATPDDPALPRALVVDPDGRERFRKYLPFPSFVNTIENYPYPYVIGRLCWEFPCVVPSDWEAQNLNGPNNPRSIEDMKAALDAVVRKQGVFNFVFHPHGWIRNTQVVELIDHAVRTHGRRVKFLSFREAQERLDANLLGGQPLRAADGRDNGVRLLDLNNDGHLDVVIGNESVRSTRLWDPAKRAWSVGDFPASLVAANPGRQGRDRGARFGVVRNDGFASMILINDARDDRARAGWHFTRQGWARDDSLVAGLEADGEPVATARGSTDLGVRLRDLDGDGLCELIVGNRDQNAVFARLASDPGWTRLPFRLPDGVRVVNSSLREAQPSNLAETDDAGLRFVDVDEDGRSDLVFSDDVHSRVDLFDSMESGWSRRALAEVRPTKEELELGGQANTGKSKGRQGLPPIVHHSTNNGFWVHSRRLWWQNEQTDALPDLVDRRAFGDLLKDVAPRAKPPEASRRSIRARPGFVVELAASEPLVADPIAFDWGADGRLWVLEMGDYPLGLDGKGKPGGVVRVLRDKDGDGRYDASTVFLDGLRFPTGLLPWRDGLIVASAPEILYATDPDGDGRADRVEVLFTGFGEGNQQHRLNGFELGLDGWIYGANGDSGGSVRSTKTGRTVDIGHRDFRFRPDDGRFEPESGPTQYGRHRDDWGNWFGNNNPTWAWHYVLADAELRRNPSFAPPDPRQTLEPDTTLYPISRTVPRFNDPGAAGRVTSANSPTPYRDDLFGPSFAGSLFVSEPVHNLVHRMVLEPDGPTYRGRRAPGESDREFLASADGWTRPTMLRTGPDGALWVADMYRAVIEHPEWIPDEWEARLDLRAGSAEGRIYRVYPVGTAPRAIPDLTRLDTPGLVAALESPNGWQRDTAHRLLLHRADPAAVEPLRRLVAATGRPQTRVQAMWVLENLQSLTPESVRVGLADPLPQVRRNAIKAGEGLLGASPALAEDALRLADDPDARVRLQLALSLGSVNDPRAAQALARIARRDPADPWIRAAVLSSATPHAGALIAALFAESGAEPPPEPLVGPLFATALAGGGAGRLDALATAIGGPRGKAGAYAAWQFAAVGGLLDAAGRAGSPPAAPELRPFAGIWKAARDLADDDRAPAETRERAVRLLGRDPSSADDDRARLARLLRHQVPVNVQLAAIEALGRTRDPKVPDALLAGWPRLSPVVRDAVLGTLLSRDAWTAALLSSLEDGCVRPAEIGPTHRRRLLGLRAAEQRARAEALFSGDGGPRREVVSTYRPALTMSGDRGAGAATFRKICASCHRLGGEGTEVGPDLGALTDTSPEALLVAILDPNRAFEAKYVNFIVSTKDGRVLTGMIAAETAGSVTLRRQEGKQDVLLRADIDEMASTGQSLMPEGLERDLSPKDVADLLAFLARTARPPTTPRR